MLILRRRKNEGITIRVPPSDKEQTVHIILLDRAGGMVRLGFTSDNREILIDRDELLGEVMLPEGKISVFVKVPNEVLREEK